MIPSKPNLAFNQKRTMLWVDPFFFVAKEVNQTPAQVLLAWAIQRGTAVLTTPRTPARARENFNISAIPKAAFDKIDGIKTRQRLNAVVETGVPGFIPQRG